MNSSAGVGLASFGNPGGPVSTSHGRAIVDGATTDPPAQDAVPTTAAASERCQAETVR